MDDALYQSHADIEIQRFTDLDIIDLLTGTVVNQSDAVISHTDECGENFSP